jgi:hypothetical protein
MSAKSRFKPCIGEFTMDPVGYYIVLVSIVGLVVAIVSGAVAGTMERS